MKLKCIIVDDEPMARKVLEEYIHDTDFLELVGKAENPLKAISVLGNQQIDLMFLDINMPKLSGMEFLKASQHLPMTILTTAYEEYALEGFELNVLDYLLKPISFERFLKASQKAKEFFELKNSNQKQKEDDFFFVKCNGKIEKVVYDDLFYIEAMMNYVVLHTRHKKMIVYLTLKSILEQLPSSIFLKVHKSFIINLTKVKGIEGNQIDISLNKVIMSQSIAEEVMEKIIKGRLIKR